MYYVEKPFRYPIRIPPAHKAYVKMKPAEAEEHFKWYVASVPKRIECLCAEASKSELVPRDSLDLSPESLLPLWKWFLQRAEVEETPQAQLDRIMANTRGPAAFVRDVLRDAKRQLSLETEFILQDIAKYLAEVFIRHTPGVYWAYYTKPRTDVYVNMPLLRGFKDWDFSPPFEMSYPPYEMVRKYALDLLREEAREDELYLMYLRWSVKNAPTEAPTQERMRSLKDLFDSRGHVLN